MSQTTYNEAPAIAFEGMQAEGTWDEHLRTYTDPANATAFGRAAIDGANPGEFQVPNGADGKFIGVTAHSHHYEPGTVPLATEGAAATDPVNVMSKGRIWVFPEAAVTDITTQDVYYRHSNAGADPEGVGRFRPDDDGASGDVTQLATARWLSTGGAGTPVLLEVNLP